MLELIERGAAGAEHPVPVLFVHGGFHAAWCWEDHFLPYFAERGFRAAALSLRSHGGSACTRPMNSHGIADYLDDVGWAADRLGGAPILVGHSMGGFLTQRHLETHSAPAAVLLASVPPTGTLANSLRVFRRHPVNTIKTFARRDARNVIATPELVREALFSPSTPETVVAGCLRRLDSESMRATAWDMVRHLPRPERVDTPILVLGAQCDGFVSSGEIHATAAAYRTRAEFFPGMGHDMMLEPGWRDVADRIIGWLAQRGL